MIIELGMKIEWSKEKDWMVGTFVVSIRYGIDQFTGQRCECSNRPIIPSGYDTQTIERE